MKHMKKILLMSMMITTFWGISYTSTYALSPSQALAQAQAAAAARGGVVQSYNPLTREISWGCTNGAVRWKIPVPPGESPPEWVPKKIVLPACSQAVIVGWNTIWDTCNISSKWKNDGTIQCTQKEISVPISWVCEGKQDINYDDKGEPIGVTCDTSMCGDVPAPVGQTFQSHTATLYMWEPGLWHNDAYANNIDTNDIFIPITTDEVLWWASIGWWSNQAFLNPGKITNISASWGTISADRISFNWDTALNFEDVREEATVAWYGQNNWGIPITWIKSYAPLFINNGTVSFETSGTGITRNNVHYRFKKPFSWEIKVYDTKNKNWSGAVQIGTTQQYKVVWINHKNIQITDYTIENFTNQIQALDTQNHFVSTKSLSGATLKKQDGVIFYASMNTATWATKLWEPGLKIAYPPIVSYYFIDGNKKIKVRYYLNANEEWDSDDPLIQQDSQEFIWVRVIGWIQWGWKSEFTWQKANISNLYNSEMRTQVRKSAYNYVKNMSSGQILNGVKYVKWNTTISGNLDYETLVVVDGNVIINGDLNTADKSLWIIVLKDNYDVNTDYAWQGNIYITPNVKQINAIMYSDGAFISANSAGQPYIKDTIDRTEKLQTQLFMKGSLFTRNTIWGAILAWWNYVLPGGTKISTGTDEFEKAMIYDLNYIRRGNIWCDISIPKNDTCNDIWEYSDPFIIKYDSRIQTKPPKLFSY